jgi:hypothetical protein
MQTLHEWRVTVLKPKLLVVFNLFSGLVRLVQTKNADAIGMCSVKAFDVERGD